MQMLNKKKDHEVSVKVDITEKVEDCNRVKEETITKSATENANVEQKNVLEDSNKVEEIERRKGEINIKNVKQNEKIGENI
jgi:hypothetical protein